MTDVKPKPPVNAALVAVPEASAAVLYGMHEVLAAVGKIWDRLTGQDTGVRAIAPSIVARSEEPFRTTLGVPVAADGTFSDPQQFDIVIVPDLELPASGTIRFAPDCLAWLRQQFAGGATVCSVCTSALMLAEAGLLDELEATTHWSAADLISDRFPQVRLCPERILSPAGPEHRIITAGGSSSWTDLILYLIARFASRDEARRIAKVFLFGDRSDGQLPFATIARPRQHDDSVIGDCQVWIATNYQQANPVAGLIAHSGLKPRTFARRFRSATGYTPIEYVQTLRIEEAKQLLEATDQPIDDISLEVGYEDAGSFRRLFKRLTGISPKRYRQRFQMPEYGVDNLAGPAA